MENNESILTELGENYEYVRTIVSNEIELVKINASETTAKVLGFVALAVLILLGSLLVLVGLLITLAIYLSSLLNSAVLGVLITTLILAIAVFLIIIFRRKLFFEPIAYAMFNRYESKRKK
ncbi:hypothetical protein [Portibacter marinus]|uniref:hypothetical protein n=1 Tax=Portibacter marinus TaxID=2898660 RepID=UPI001F15A64B|nr:hypothetical protein [Portibacter marinus]